MQKALLVYAGILIALGVFAYFTYLVPHGTALLTTTLNGGNGQNSTATTTAGAITTTSVTTTTILSQSCFSSNPTEPVYNGDFSMGNYSGWNQTNGGFGSAPTNLSYANAHQGYYNHTWVGYLGNFFASTFHGGIGVQPGNLTSQQFKITEPFLNFKIISPAQADLYVQVLRNNVPIIVTHYNTYIASNPYPSSQFMNASMPLSSFLCQNVTIRVVAGVVGGFASSRQYIAVGDFQLSKSPYPNANLIIVNQTIVGT